MRSSRWCAIVFFLSGFLTSIPGVLISNFGQPILAWMLLCFVGLVVSVWAPCSIFGHEPVPGPCDGPVMTITLYGVDHYIMLCSRCHAVYWGPAHPHVEKSITHKDTSRHHEG